jgi:hypothetical protein
MGHCPLDSTQGDVDDMTAQTPTTMTRELDSRTSNGINVRLLWHEPDGRVFVAVADSRTGDAFYMEVRDRERMLEVFHHPYAYEASYRVDARAVPGAGAAETSTKLAV